MTLYLSELDATIQISFEGEYQGQYVVTVNDVLFSALPEFKEEVKVPDVGHSIVEEFEGAHTHRIDFLIFLKGRRTPVSVQHDMRAGLLTLEVRGKRVKWWQARNFLDAFEKPYVFIYEDIKFMLRKRIDAEGEEIEALDLDVHGLIFNKHPFMSKDFGKYR